ncbi:putative laminin subunit alpha-1 [Apostichopus japonicus]|uniref:Putative laminin subunit alpha-1 n=1 Tax=Stichopus japonicus TaxID=307972 RepID=A0A2G8KFW3_STIJA|nr:putative laminin subunit alpha-1 [Apostichopus japonicus]
MVLDGTMVMKGRGETTFMFKVELLEQNFVFRGTNSNPTRADFMMVLAQLKTVLIRANVVQNVGTTILSKVSVDVGSRGSPSDDDVQAYAVEQCRCPQGYAGTSCEKCSEGYVRVSEGPYLGTCRPCKCNQHATSCQDGSGACVDCQDNTAGLQCEICAPGYYGDATQGTSEDCKKCACPLAQPQNNFSPTCNLLTDGRHNCTACLEGYVGRFCESCEDGYFGDPLMLNGSCQPCECNAAGAVSPLCNKSNGLCHCKEGVSGDKCNECPVGFTLDGDGCITCMEDACGGTLLEELNKMEGSFNISFDASLFVIIPWSRYYRLENQTAVVTSAISLFQEDLSVVKPLIKSSAREVDKRKLDGVKLLAQMEDLGSRSKTSVNSTHLNLQRSLRLQRNITNLMMNLNNSYDELQRKCTHKSRCPWQPTTNYSNEREKFYLKLKKGIFKMSQITQSKNIEITYCHSSLRLSVAAFELSSSSALRLTELREAIVNVSQTLSDLRDDLRELLNMSDASGTKIRAASSLNNDSATSLKTLKKYSRRTESIVKKIKKVLESAGELTNSSRVSISLQTNRFRGAENASLIAAVAADGAYNEVKCIVAVFSQCNFCLAGAYNQTFLRDDRRLTEVALELKLLSEDQRSLVVALKERISKVAKNLKQGRKKVKRLQKKMTKAETSLESIVTALPPLEEKDLSSTANFIRHLATDTYNKSSLSAIEAESYINKLQQLEYSLSTISHDMADCQNFTDRARSNVISTKKTVGNFYSVTSFLDNKAMVIQRSGSKVQGDITNLRKLIRTAKNEVSKIKLSLSSSGNCSRVYRPATSPSAYNSLAFTVKIGRPNNQLFYIGGNGSDFLSVETIDYQVIYKWNVGSGIGVVSSPIIMDLDKWYRIEATRVSQTGYLLVEDVENPKNAPPVSGSAPVGRTILDINEHSLMFIGGVPSSHELKVVNTQNFEGCMGEVIFDDVSVGLWNFESIEGDCQACASSPKILQERRYGFDGSGYSMVRAPSSFLANFIYIAFSVRTLSQDALLFFMSSADQADFVSVELKDGRVVSKLDLGEGFIFKGAQIWIPDFTVACSLYVNGLKVASAATAVSSDGLTLAPFTKMYIGGLPFNFPMRRDVTTNAFRGCLKDFNLYRSTQDLLQPGQSFGITENCVPSKVERSVGLAGSGSVALRPVALGREADITLTFTTLQEDAVILAAGDLQTRKKRDVNFDAVDVSYTFALVKGLLQVQVNAGQGRLTLETRKSDGKLNDGRPHVILMQKSDKRIRITIDDLNTRSGRLPGTNVLIPARSPLYVGNTMAGIAISRQVRSLPPFSGCIENLVIMGKLLAFNNATEFRNAEIGFCGPLSLPPPQPTEQPSLGPSGELTSRPNALVRSCHNPATPDSIPYGLRFGITTESYATVDIVPAEISKVFTMSVELRTVKEYGMIFYMADRLERNYCALMLMKGFVLFIFNIGTGSATILTDYAIDDGYWHVIHLTRNRKTGTIQVDGQGKRRVRTIGSASRLNVASPLYVGGLPKDFQTKQIGEEIGSFSGCIRKLELNNKIIDLPDVAMETKGTSLCYTDTEPGAFFPGDGYIIQESNLQLQRDMSIELEFKTSSKDGVLFGLVNEGSAYIILELKNLAINLRSSNGEETFLVTFNNPPVLSLCDNEWHSIIVKITLGKLELEVDGNNTIATHRMPGSAGGRYLLFAGGISDGFLLDEWAPPYHGCLRNFVFNGSRKEFALAEDIQGAVPDKCPYV